MCMLEGVDKQTTITHASTLQFRTQHNIGTVEVTCVSITTPFPFALSPDQFPPFVRIDS
jgi:hypothetical protein